MISVRPHVPKDPSSPCRSVLDLDTGVREQPRSLFCAAEPAEVLAALGEGGPGYLDTRVLIEGAQSRESKSHIEQVMQKHGVPAWCACRVVHDRVFVDLPKTQQNDIPGMRGGNVSGLGIVIDAQGAQFLNQYIDDDRFDGTFAAWKALDDRMRLLRPPPPPIPTPAPRGPAPASSSPPAPASPPPTGSDPDPSAPKP